MFSNVVTRVENDADEATRDPEIPIAVNVLINDALVPNEPEIPAFVKPLPPPPSSNEVTLVENDADDAPNAPDISVAICADPDNVPAATAGLFSNVVTRVLKLALGAVNDPLIPADVNGDANAPDISVAICAELESTPLGNVVDTFISSDPSPTNEPLNIEPVTGC